MWALVHGIPTLVLLQDVVQPVDLLQQASAIAKLSLQPQPLDADHHHGKDQKDNAPDMHQIGVLKSPSFAKAGHEVSQLAV